MTSHIVVSGSFDSNYTMTITSEGGSLPAARTITLEAKWLGPCAADQKPGDMLMSNGVKMNIIDMQKAMRPPGAPGAAARALIARGFVSGSLKREPGASLR